MGLNDRRVMNTVRYFVKFRTRASGAVFAPEASIEAAGPGGPEGILRVIR